MRLQFARVVAIAPLLLAFLPSAAHAQTENAAAAEQLFQDAKSLEHDGKWAEACQKFDASYALDSALGTLLNSADCHERIGKTASAWAQFLEAGTRARRSNQPDREAAATDRANALAPRLTRLKVIVPQASRAMGLEIRCDGTLQPEESWDVAIPVDPGPVVIRVSAPTKEDWGTVVDVQGEGKVAEVTVPPLKDAPQTAPPPAQKSVTTPPGSEEPASRPSSSSFGTQKIIGVAVAGVGVVSIGVGSVFGIVAMSKWNGGNDCPNDKCVNADAQQKAADAKTFGNVSTVLWVVGGAAVAGGAVLYFTAPKKQSAVGFAPIVAPSVAGASLTGRF